MKNKNTSFSYTLALILSWLFVFAVLAATFFLIRFIVQSVSNMLPVILLSLATAYIVPTVPDVLLHKLGTRVLKKYFKTPKFLSMKGELQADIEEWNALIAYLKDLKSADSIIPPFSVVNCSADTYEKAIQKPLKYFFICSSIEESEETLTKLENLLNDFYVLQNSTHFYLNKDRLLSKKFHKKFPFIVQLFLFFVGFSTAIEILGESMGKATEILGWKPPEYHFKKQRAHLEDLDFTITFDLENLERLSRYLAKQLQKKENAQAPRPVLSIDLIEKIQKRDSYTCQKCGNCSTKENPLLLEIGHIVPLSQNGFSTEDNLQTLCWKCKKEARRSIFQEKIG